MSKKDVVKRYTKRRKQLGLSHKRAAEEIGLHWSSLLRYENAQREPDTSATEKILEWLDGTTEEEAEHILSEVQDTLKRRIDAITDDIAAARIHYENLLIEKGQLREALINTYRGEL